MIITTRPSDGSKEDETLTESINSRWLTRSGWGHLRSALGAHVTDSFYSSSRPHSSRWICFKIYSSKTREFISFAKEMHYNAYVNKFHFSLSKDSISRYLGVKDPQSMIITTRPSDGSKEDETLTESINSRWLTRSGWGHLRSALGARVTDSFYSSSRPHSSRWICFKIYSSKHESLYSSQRKCMTTHM